MLDVNPRGRSTAVRGREGIIVTAIGEDRLTLLEILGEPGSSFSDGERIDIGREGRTKVQAVLGKVEYGGLSPAAQAGLPGIVEGIVASGEARFVGYVNRAQPLTPRIHALELIPGVGKTYARAIIDERERSPFASYRDIEERVGLKDPVGRIAERIVEEVTGRARTSIFAKR